ncbi:hypothetical protein JCM21531_1269 [Acetivibrio straminisolvens JCM 21531]|uniref:Uncharacterized protein n=1 Tax=Acetivibrio straminisolvens JCM 21531 TaxID=1294263 RepID=W4V330_9FIRM|nr:hypothetical protein JCM21531_1269 [Acetivibrio straminisolvens JCM 21531]
MADSIYGLQSALNSVSRNLNIVNDNVRQVAAIVDQVNNRVNTVDNNVKVVYNELDKLTREFHEYVQKAEYQHNLSVAETRLIKIRQELENKFGHYSEIRRTTVGILQANDLDIIRKETITSATEELMLSAPGYWLAPALVALAAWINDNKELADKAVREALHRNDEKTSLLFALICRRADRKSSCLKWIQRYLANQNEENLDRKTIIILDAFASGLLGVDSEGIVAKQLEEWIMRLEDKPGFVEQQMKQWSDAINLKRSTYSGGYEYLRKYSKTWSKLQYIMEGAYLHANLFDYFEKIFNKQSSNSALKEQLDEILYTLVTEFDDEELPLREEERLNQLIIDNNGNLARARQTMQLEKTAFETHKDFTQLLTDAAMKPELVHASVSTQKFAIALSRDWIAAAYNDIIAKNRMEIPHEIEINVDTFNDTTIDGKNEAELLKKWETLVNEEKEKVLSQHVLNAFQKFCLFGGAAIGIIGLIACFTGQIFLGPIAIIAGCGMIINHFTKKKAVKARRKNIETQFGERLEKGAQIIRATLAEVVDFRSEFAEKDSESKKFSTF